MIMHERMSRTKIVLIVSSLVFASFLTIFLTVELGWTHSENALRGEAEAQNNSSFGFPVGFAAVSGSSPPARCGTANRVSTIPTSMTAGDVFLIRLIFDCNVSNLQESMRDDGLELEPQLYAPGFDIDPVLTTAFVDRDFYCITAPDDGACTGDSTTKPDNLGWTWSLRPQSSGHHLIVFVVNQHRVGSPADDFAGLPHYIYISSTDVHDPLTVQFSSLSGVVAVLSGVFAFMTFIYHTACRCMPGRAKDASAASASAAAPSSAASSSASASADPVVKSAS
jgi:hypothetical protein